MKTKYLYAAVLFFLILSFFGCKKQNEIMGAIASSIIVFLLVALIFLQFKTVDETKEANIEDLRDSELQAQIAQYKERYSDANGQYLENMNLINEYNNPSSEDSSASTNILNSEYKQSLKMLGLTDVQGQGIIITLTDTENGNYRSEDLRTLVNELKYAGAEAIPYVIDFIQVFAIDCVYPTFPQFIIGVQRYNKKSKYASTTELIFSNLNK